MVPRFCGSFAVISFLFYSVNGDRLGVQQRAVPIALRLI